MTALISLITILLIPTYTSTYIANFPEYLEKPQLTLFSNTQNDNENNLPTIETALSWEIPNISKTYKNFPLFSTNDLQRPHRSKNIGRDTNNPGNLLNGLGSGAIGVYKSPNGNYYSVFATVQDGYQAMIQEIEHRKTTTKKSRQSLSAFLGGRVLGKNGKLDPDSYYYHIAMSIAGGDLSIQEISTETLAKIIMIGEATREAYQQGGVNLQHLLTKQ